MAYGNFLASVSLEEIEKLRNTPSYMLNVDVLEQVSHLVGYWVKVQPLGELLGQALDGGEIVSASLHHPLRSPTFHTPGAAEALQRKLAQAWTASYESVTSPEMEWFRIEIEKVLGVFDAAVSHGHGVISVLEPPMDEERASLVHIPFVVPKDVDEDLDQ
jgi:hypothetical protein